DPDNLAVPELREIAFHRADEVITDEVGVFENDRNPAAFRPVDTGDAHQAKIGRKRASQSDTADATALLLLSECVPGMSTTLRFGPGGGIPNGSRSPWTTRVGTLTDSSSASRVFSGFPGGCSGKARHSTATAAVSAAVRQAT